MMFRQSHADMVRTCEILSPVEAALCDHKCEHHQANHEIGAPGSHRRGRRFRRRFSALEWLQITFAKTSQCLPYPPHSQPPTQCPLRAKETKCIAAKVSLIRSPRVRTPYISTVTRTCPRPSPNEVPALPRKACVSRRDIMRRTQNQPKSMLPLPRKGEEHASSRRRRRKKGLPVATGPEGDDFMRKNRAGRRNDALRSEGG